MKRFILTVGPALLNEVPLTEVHDGRNIYRINGAHGSVEDVEQTILKIRDQVPDADILMDLPGNKVRTKDLPDGGVRVEEGKTFALSSRCFNYPGFYKHLKPGMTAWANDSIFEFEVVSADKEKIVFLSKSDGVLINNKGVHVRAFTTTFRSCLKRTGNLSSWRISGRCPSLGCHLSGGRKTCGRRVRWSAGKPT